MDRLRHELAEIEAVAPDPATDGNLDARLSVLEHAEDLASQERCVALYEALAARARPDLADTFARFVGYAQRHRDVIARFGRFPHRNAALGRAPSEEERAYLAEGGEDFSGSQVEAAS